MIEERRREMKNEERRGNEEIEERRREMKKE